MNHEFSASSRSTCVLYLTSKRWLRFHFHHLHLPTAQIYRASRK